MHGVELCPVKQWLAQLDYLGVLPQPLTQLSFTSSSQLCFRVDQRNSLQSEVVVEMTEPPKKKR